MACTGDTRSTVRTAARTAVRAVGAGATVAALVTGGVLTADPAPATGPAVPSGARTILALPESIGAANRAW